jgi:CheY-like chemotaxis protein/anti-sigma regulatory factor (Ser/Thr protein kinase)
MRQETTHILVVDDEPLNLEIIQEILDGSDYEVSTAEDGFAALERLEANPENFDVILLDRMMPRMDGLEVLARVKQHPILKHCPVILQTARAGKDEILEGLQAGAYYYLTKPFEENMLLSVVKTAARDRLHYKQLLQTQENNKKCLGLMQHGRFRFRTLAEAKALAAGLASSCPDPAKVVMGLSELMINAVEHGNLGITYDEKSRLNAEGKWEDEVNQRLEMEKYRDKSAEVHFARVHGGIEITIADQGDGFEWKQYLKMRPERAMDNHGRGIAMAGLLSFPRIEYRGKGNEVCVLVDT